LIALVASGSACTTAIPPAPPARLAPVASTAPAPMPTSRWLHANRAAQIGPVVPGGTLVLLGGRRALVAADGHVETEKQEAPEALFAIASVPTPGGPVVVGLGPRRLYRFDTPLGAAVPIVDFRWPTYHAFSTDAGTVLIEDEKRHTTRFDPRTGANLGDAPRPPDAVARSAPDRSAPPLLRWIAATGADPLALAITNGIGVDDRTAIIASNGLVARVDLATGNLLELVPYPERAPANRRNGGGACEAARVGHELWFFCPWVGSAGVADRRTMSFGVLNVRVDPAGLLVKLGRAFEIVGRDQGKQLVASSMAGGVLLRHPCRWHDLEAVFTQMCVGQPDGTFSTFAGAMWSWPDGAPEHTPSVPLVPLADGRLAGIYGAHIRQPPHVELVGPTGVRTSLSPMPIAFSADSTVTVKGFEETDGALDLAMEETSFIIPRPTSWRVSPSILTGWLVRQPLNGDAAAVRRIPNAAVLAVGRGHAIAFLETDEAPPRVLISNDGGASVFEEAAPTPRRPESIVANEVGAFLGDHFDDGWLRVGWAPIAPQGTQ
jgi:hypothetical protein